MAEVLYLMPGERGGIPTYPRQPRPAPPALPPGDYDYQGAPGAGGGVTAAPGAGDRKPNGGLIDVLSETARLAILSQQSREPSFCLGAENAICAGADGKPLLGFNPVTGAPVGPDQGKMCRAMMNGVCLVTGVFVLLALLGLSLNALLRS